MTEAMFTHAVLSSFDARERGSDVELFWETASETGTAGFYLYRYDCLATGRSSTRS